MAIDKGPSLIKVLLEKKLVKTNPHGYILTQEGVEVLFNAIANITESHNDANVSAKRSDGFIDQTPED